MYVHPAVWHPTAGAIGRARLEAAVRQRPVRLATTDAERPQSDRQWRRIDTAVRRRSPMHTDAERDVVSPVRPADAVCDLRAQVAALPEESRSSRAPTAIARRDEAVRDGGSARWGSQDDARVTASPSSRRERRHQCERGKQDGRRLSNSGHRRRPDSTREECGTDLACASVRECHSNVLPLPQPPPGSALLRPSAEGREMPRPTGIGDHTGAVCI